MYNKKITDFLGESKKALEGKKDKRLHFVSDKATREKIEKESNESGLTITEYIMLAVLAFNIDVIEGENLEHFNEFLDVLKNNRACYRIKDEQGQFVALTDADRKKMANILKTENFNLRLSQESLDEIKRRAKKLSELAGRPISASNYVAFVVKYFEISVLDKENEE